MLYNLVIVKICTSKVFRSCTTVVLVLERYSMLGFRGKLGMLNLHWLDALHVTSTRATRRAVALDAFFVR